MGHRLIAEILCPHAFCLMRRWHEKNRWWICLLTSSDCNRDEAFPTLARIALRPIDSLSKLGDLPLVLTMEDLKPESTYLLNEEENYQPSNHPSRRWPSKLLLYGIIAFLFGLNLLQPLIYQAYKLDKCASHQLSHFGEYAWNCCHTGWLETSSCTQRQRDKRRICSLYWILNCECNSEGSSVESDHPRH